MQKLISILLLVMLCFTAAADEGTDDLTWQDRSLASLVLVDRVHDPEAFWSFDEDAELLHIWFPRIHDCDAAVISCGGETILIDCCDKAQAYQLTNLLMAVHARKIDRLFNTHPHPDHIGGFAAVHRTAPVGELLICFHEFYNDHMQNALSVAAEQRIPVHHYADGDSFRIGSAQLTVIQKSEPDWTLNEQSAVMKLTFGDRSFLFMADTQPRTFERLAGMDDRSGIEADIIKYPHHGVDLLSEDFIYACGFDFAVITNTDRVTDVMAQLDSHGIPYALTAQSALHLVTDGRVWLAETFDVEQEMRGLRVPE